MIRLEKSMCRACPAGCPVNVTLEADRVIKVEGNPGAPLYEGFICPKGRALAVAHNDPRRLAHSLKRMPDGSYVEISNEQLIDEISAKLQTILTNHGPRAVAGFLGNPYNEQPLAGPVLTGFLNALGSDNLYTDATIDQPGMMIAKSLHGGWAGGDMRAENCEVFLMVGGNPIISKQYFSQHPGRQLKAFRKNGMKLIVIDPRRSETARHAAVHLQCIPGEDPTIIAGLIHLLIENDAVDREFIDVNARGMQQLAGVVRAFAPQYVAERAGVSEELLREAAHLIGRARTGSFGAGVGASMGTRGTLSTYLLLCLQTLRGFWPREGDEAAHPGVLIPRTRFKAQPLPPTPAWGFGRTLRTRGLQMTSAGMPTGALPEEILTPGPDQVRALFLHSGAMLSWPQADLAKRALQSLDLLVVHDIEVSATARVASYVVATKLQFEVPDISHTMELAYLMHPGYGCVEPFASYHPALLDPPSGVDVLESWQTYYRIAKKLGLKLRFSRFCDTADTAAFFDMQREPSTEELYEVLCAGSAVPLGEVKKYPDGKVFEQAREFVGPRDANCDARFELANPTMLEQLQAVRAESYQKRRGTDDEFPFLYVTRRIQNTTNGSKRPEGILKIPYNPAYLHSEDLRQLGIACGDLIEIRSRHGSIVGIVDVDDNLRPGVLSMSHGFGQHPHGEAYDPRRHGSNVNRLLSMEDDYDRYNGMPRMSAVPVAITPIENPADAQRLQLAPR